MQQKGHRGSKKLWRRGIIPRKCGFSAKIAANRGGRKRLKSPRIGGAVEKCTSAKLVTRSGRSKKSSRRPRQRIAKKCSHGVGGYQKSRATRSKTAANRKRAEQKRLVRPADVAKKPRAEHTMRRRAQKTPPSAQGHRVCIGQEKRRDSKKAAR